MSLTRFERRHFTWRRQEASQVGIAGIGERRQIYEIPVKDLLVLDAVGRFSPSRLTLVVLYCLDQLVVLIQHLQLI